MVYSILLATITWVLATIFYAYQYVLRVLPNTINPDLIAKFQITASEFGDFNSLYYIGYAGLHLPLGIMMARFGVKRILPLCIGIAVIGMLPLIYSNVWYFSVIGRFLVGVGSSAAALGLIQIVRENFSPSKFSTLLGISVACGLLGAMYTGEPLEYVIALYGWEEVLKGLMAIGLIIATLIYLIIPKPTNANTDGEFNSITWGEVIKVLSNPYVLLLGLVGGLMVGPLEGLADAWSKGFFMNVYDLDSAVAGRLGSLIFLGMALGCATLGFISEKLKAYYVVTIISASVMATALFSIIPGGLNVSLLYILMPIVGYFSAYQILVVTMGGDFVKPKYKALASVLVNTIMMSFGTVFHSSIGRLMSYYGEVSNSGEMVYGAHAYINSLSIIPYALVIAGVTLSLMVLSIRIRLKSANVSKIEQLAKEEA